MSLACEIKFPGGNTVVLPVPCQLYAKEFDLANPGTLSLAYSDRVKRTVNVVHPAVHVYFC